MPGLIQPERAIRYDNDGTAYVSVKSLFSGKWSSRTMVMTKAQFDLYQSGEKIQNALPHLTPDEREFLLTGATPEEWDEAFPEDED